MDIKSSVNKLTVFFRHCTYSNASPFQVNLHEKRKHVDRTIPCKLCDRKFSTNSTASNSRPNQPSESEFKVSLNAFIYFCLINRYRSISGLLWALLITFPILSDHFILYPNVFQMFDPPHSNVACCSKY